MSAVCPRTGLTTDACLCWYYDPANPHAVEPSRAKFDQYLAAPEPDGPAATQPAEPLVPAARS